MAAEILTLDPTSENAANSPLVLTTGSYGLTEHRYPQPAIDPQWASSVSTEGSVLASQRYQNREIAITVEVDCTANLTPLRTLQAKLAKLAREGGTLQRTMSDATVIVFDVLTCDGYDPSFDQTWHLGAITTVSFTLTCKPEGRGPEVTLTGHTETTNPALVFTETGIKGDLPARGRLVISDAQAQDQWWVTWGVETNAEYDTSATSAPLFIEAEGRTLLGDNVSATASTGASSTAVVKTNLTTDNQAFLSTQATGGGAHLTHVGSFRVYARCKFPAANTGIGSIALEWATGDFRRRTTNTAVSDVEQVWTGIDAWLIKDMGIVTLPAVAVGVQRWEGRLIASSTAPGDAVHVDWLMLVPADYGSGVAKGVQLFETPTTASAKDVFAQTAGALAGKTLTTGGTWSGAGDADDFTVTGSGTAQRTAVSDTNGNMNLGRWEAAGVTTYTNIFSQVSMSSSAVGGVEWGVFARYIDINNWVAARVITNGIGPNDYTVVNVVKGIGGVLTGVQDYAFATRIEQPGVTVSLRLFVDDRGRTLVWFWLSGSSPGSPIITTQIPELQTGGTLATGKVGFWEHYTSSSAATRTYDNFVAAVPARDAAVFASQSLEVRSDSTIREDTAGAFWTPVSNYEGDYVRIPPAGSEGRTARFIVKGSRTEAGAMPDVSAADDISGQLIYTPRYLAIPGA